jgi:tetratricopeptide (TPR) repeat protein
LTGQAQMLADPALQALHVADRPEDLQRAALKRLSAQADDAQAVLALTLAALERDDPAARQAALPRAQACAERLPASAACQYSYGVLLGLQAASEGLVKAMRSVGAVKGALTAAHEADPAWYPARSALVEFHLLAPGMLGGSRSKADELARRAPRPEQVAALQARLAMQDKQWQPALALLAALPALQDTAVLDDVHSWGTQAALGLVNNKEPAKAQAWFERLMRERPGRATGAYGLARVRGELGDWAEAQRLLEQAQGLKGASNWPVLYRLGIAQQQQGRLDAAKASYQAFVSAGKGQKASLDDARKRLEQLGG